MRHTSIFGYAQEHCQSTPSSCGCHTLAVSRQSVKPPHTLPFGSKCGTRRHTSIFGCALLATTYCLATGCEGPGLAAYEPVPPRSASAQTTATADQAAEYSPADALARQADELAQRIAGASAYSTPRNTYQPRDIIWRDLASQPQANTAIEPTHSPTPSTNANQAMNEQVPSASATQPTTTDAPQPIRKVDSQPTPATRTVTKLTYNQAYQQLLSAIKRSEDANLSKAIAAATLGTVGPHGELDWSLLEPLSPKDRERVQRYHKAVAALRDQALAPDGVIDQAAITGKLGEVFGDQPIEIRSIKLCEKVLGYGVYEAFPDDTFPVGRDQKMIVYVELDHFKPALSSTGEGYEVRLKQELELYESNGFEVWSHEPVQIVDVSRNQRQDFFVVQLVTLPGKLALGQYHLKVRIYDENSGTRDEVSIPIRIATDATLVSRQRP